MIAKLQALCVADKKGERKRPVDSAAFRAGHGIDGDAHAGPWHRQVSLLSAADIDMVRRKGLLGVAPGDFAENVVISGLNFCTLGLGTRLRLGRAAVLSITQIGKVCHSPCRIYRLTGDCIMPKLGLFARVEAGGEVHVGDSVEVLKIVPRDRLQAVVLTISDRCPQGESQRPAGRAVARYLEESLRAHVYRTEVVADDKAAVADRLTHYSDGHSINLVVTVGGTGFAQPDITREATRTLLERPAASLDEAVPTASVLERPHGMPSAGTSGIRASTLIVNLPDSERSAVENLDVILGALRQSLQKLCGDTADCSLSPWGKKSNAR